MPTDLPDRLLAKLLARTPFYAEGWGDPGLIREVMHRLAEPTDPVPIEVRWSRRNGLAAEGWFPSPVADLPVPPRARTAYFRMDLPPEEVDEPSPPVCIFLAATGDQGYAMRRLITAPLVRRGVGSILLQNPYYGTRKPPRQKSVAPRRFVDQLLMNYATVEESRSLLAWLKAQGFEHVGVSGYSMGGFMAAYVAAATPFAVAAVPCAAGNSAGPTFTESPLSAVPDWASLGDEMEGDEDPRVRFLELVNAYTISRWEPPVDPQSAIIVALRQDAIIPVSEVMALHEHWPGSRLRWIEGSHATNVFGRVRAIREAVYDAFAIRLYRAGAE